MAGMEDVEEDWGEKLMIKYIGQKVSRVRWKPSYYGKIHGADKFITGAWDDEANLVSLWTTNKSTRGIKSNGNEVNGEPEVLCSVVHNGSVTDMQFVSTNHLLTSSSMGHLTLYAISKDDKHISQEQRWELLHHNKAEAPCSCTSLSVSQSNVATVGEDGRINVIQLDHKVPLRVIDGAECVTTNAVIHTQSNEIATIGATGQLKIWDLKQSSNKPTRTMLLSGDKVSLESIDRHPHQPHLLITGAADGIIGVWDVRHERYPVTLLEAHESEVWEVKFHPQNPDNLFTCSEDGSAWYWDGTSIATTTTSTRSKLPMPNMDGSMTSVQLSQQSSSPWLFVDTNKHKLETYSLLPVNNLPVNSLDVDGNSLICGTDGEAIIIVQDLPIK